MKRILFFICFLALSVFSMVKVKTNDRCTGFSQFRFEDKGLNVDDLPNWHLTWSHDPFDKNADARFVLNTSTGQLQYG